MAIGYLVRQRSRELCLCLVFIAVRASASAAQRLSGDMFPLNRMYQLFLPADAAEWWGVGRACRA